MKKFTQEIDSTGFECMVKKPNLVLMQQQTEDFEVETAEGLMKGHPGDYLAHDPMSGHVWPVKQSYVALHYEPTYAPGGDIHIDFPEDQKADLVEIRNDDGTPILVIHSLDHGMAIAKVVAQAQRIRPDGKYGILDLGALEEMELALGEMERLAGGH